MKKNIPLIATPISHQFENETFGKEIAAVSDCLEVRERSLDSEWDNQHLFHIDIDLPHDWDYKIRDYLQKAFEKKPQLSLVTLQTTCCCESKNIVDGIAQLDGKLYNREEMLDNAKINTNWLKSKLDRHVKIGIENNNYYPTPAYDIVTDGDFITDIINQNNLCLLLDIAHAMVTAHNKKINYDEYLETLPLDKMIQLHICQPGLSGNGMAYDAHDEPNDEMLFNVLSLIKEYPNIKYLTIEYYKDKDILINSINNLRNLIRANM